MNAFHSYDIRGIYNQDFNKNDVYKIGYFLPKLLKTNKVLVGFDARTSSPEIFAYLQKGIMDAGADVYNLGLSTTPMVYFITAKFKFDASVMITASHNPAEYNGLKVSTTDAKPVGFDTGLGILKKMCETKKIEVAQTKGKIIDFEKKEEYLNFLRQYLTDFSNLNVAIDCSNGMAGLLIKKLIGEKHHYLFSELDGTFPNHDPNPLNFKNLVFLQKKVVQESCDLGVIFDGDADRVMFTDEKGNFISPDLIIALMGDYFFKKENKNKKVLQDIRTSNSVKEYLSKYNADVHMWKVGRAHAALKLREIDGLFGGELAGHYYFKDFYYSDSGLLAALIVLNIVSEYKKQGVAMSKVIDTIKNYENSGEINFEIQQKLEAMNAVKDYFMDKQKPEAFFDFDGYRIEYKDWWLSIRPSNTEPY
ncbi:MAG: phosphomannomutase/phosphoglucomutase, partial [Bacteroidales bacterium]|nr:phosphomannomutase/phosphoglucomutase [Bacteroidales bacterium]